MGLFNTIKNEVQRQFIARPDEAKDFVIYKWPDSNIRLLTQLTVQQDELAVFFKGGKVEGTLQAGTHNLDGKDIPFLGALIDAATGGNFLISELYFVSTRQFTDLPFGGMVDNVMDPTTKLAVTVRVFGEYALKVENPELLIMNLVGTRQITTNDELSEWFKDLLLKNLRELISDYVSVQQKPLLGIASQTTSFEKLVLEKVSKELAEYGCTIPKIGNFTISLNDEDTAMLKQMTRDFAYANNMNAADAAVKLGMAQGLQNNSTAGSNAASSFGTAVGFGMGMAQNMTQQPTQPTTPIQPVQPTTPTK